MRGKKGTFSPVCTECGKGPKTPETFFHNKAFNDGFASKCKECIDRRRKAWAKENPTVYSDRARRLRYGMSREEYERMVDRQGGRCAICLGPPGKKGLHIDHDHGTGAVRGLLCKACNNALGFLDDDQDRLRRAIQYLNRTPAP